MFIKTTFNSDLNHILNCVNKCDFGTKCFAKVEHFVLRLIYTDDYDTLLAQIREEVASGYCPPLTTNIENLSSYDVIFIGYPIWVETAAPPIRTFLTTHDLAGRTVVPFCTSGTSSAEASYRLVRSLCPQSTVLEGIQIRRGTYDTVYERVITWLQEIGIVELNNGGNDEK